MSDFRAPLSFKDREAELVSAAIAWRGKPTKAAAERLARAVDDLCAAAGKG